MSYLGIPPGAVWDDVRGWHMPKRSIVSPFDPQMLLAARDVIAANRDNPIRETAQRWANRMAATF